MTAREGAYDLRDADNRHEFLGAAAEVIARRNLHRCLPVPYAVRNVNRG